MNNRVLILGVDGGTFRIIGPLVEEGKLPTFRKMMDEGARGILRSTSPAITAPAWTTFMTGKNPGQHGLFHFISFEKGSYDYSIINATKCRSKTMFQLAGEAGRRIISINVPVTYPPQKLNGIVLSGMLTPKDHDFTYPPGLSGELRDQGYVVDLWDDTPKSDEEYLDAVMEMSQKRLDISRKLLSENAWDLAMVVFIGSDKVQHKMWQRKDLISKYYIFLDGLLARLIEIAGDSTYVMMMSDHGFTSTKGVFLVNQWLADNGFLKKHIFKAKLPLTRRDMLGHWRRGTLFKLKFFIHNLIAGISKGRLLPYPQMSINFVKSKAFSRPAEVIFINLKERWPMGTVEPGEEYESMRREIVEKLRNLRDPETGDKIVEDVLTKDDVYSGECFDEAPDIILLPKDDGYAFIALRSYSSYIERNPMWSSGHSMNGIFILRGPDVLRGAETDTIQMADCMPTVMHLLDVPIPEDVDGRVLDELFRPGSATHEKRPESQGPSQLSGRAFEKVSDDDEKLMEEKLKGLGYLT